MNYQLWDLVSGNLLGVYPTEAEALAWVRQYASTWMTRGRSMCRTSCLTAPMRKDNGTRLPRVRS